MFDVNVVSVITRILECVDVRQAVFTAGTNNHVRVRRPENVLRVCQTRFENIRNHSRMVWRGRVSDPAAALSGPQCSTLFLRLRSEKVAPDGATESQDAGV